MIFQKFCKFFPLDGNAVSLEQLLKARDNRVALQQQCLEKYGQTVLSLTLLAVGGVKKNALLDEVFAKALEKLTACFAHLNVKPTAEFIRPLETGHEALFVLPIDATLLKKAAMELEDSSPLARLWDIDVIAPNGKLLSRTEFNVPPRPCLVCAENAKSCARSRRHSVDELLAEMQRRVQAVDFAEKIANLVCDALVREAQLGPKPGLVDCFNNGAHRDMTLQTFKQSAEALRPFFAQFVLKGIATATLPDLQILSEIRPLGLQAEQVMLRATHDVNTHKGAIFAFGLVCVAVGRLYQHSLSSFTRESVASKGGEVGKICHLVAQFTQGLTAELQHYPDDQPLTAGVRFFREYGVTGARGEAERGFALVRETIDFLTPYLSLPDTHWALIGLLYLLRENADTNLIKRGGLDGLQFVQQEASKRLKKAEILQNQAILTASLAEFDHACIARNLSAGGSADLLALTIFFLSL